MGPDRQAEKGPARSIVVIGASAGGIEALKDIVAVLPSDLAAPVCVVLHVPAWAESRLPAILARAGNLPATHGVDGEELTAGHIYVAPPGFHLTVEDGRVHLDAGPKENGHRPAIDPLFRSAARSFDGSAVCALLSGASEDGTKGMAALKAAGGVTIVQDPGDALYPTMPITAIDNVDVDLVLPTSQIGHAIAKSVARAAAEATVRGQASHEHASGNGHKEPAHDEPGEPPPGTISEFTCPECGGSLWESTDPFKPQYRCRVGHAFSLEALSEAQSLALEAALWSALRSLEESIAISERVAERSRRRGNTSVAERYERRAGFLREHARAIRGVVVHTEVQEGERTR
jgi:two-component system chemotaxis response regulator CheB